MKDKIITVVESAKEAASDKIDSIQSRFGNPSLKDLVFKKANIIKLIFVFFSLLTVHAIFFCINLPTSLYAMLDAVFIANIIFIYISIMLFVFFIFRISVPIIKGLIRCLSIALILRNRGLKHILVVIRYTRMRTKKANIIYSVVAFTTVLVLYIETYTGNYISVWIIIGGLIVIMMITPMLVTEMEKLIIGHLFHERILTWAKFRTILLKNDLLQKELLVIGFLNIGVIVAIEGNSRFHYLLKLPPVTVSAPSIKGELTYIGTTSNGSIFFDAKSSVFTYLSHDGQLVIKADKD